MQLNGAEIVIECLKEQGVDTVFGYPGGAILNVYDALYEHSNEIRHILTSHEQGAAHAADGYARATGRVGVCLATSGPGATNLVTGIATAYMDSIPVVAITCNVGVSLLGKDSFQEIDIAGITMPITKHNFIVKDVGKLIKVAAGVMNTHSRQADCRMEVFASHAAMAGADPETVKKIMESITTAEMTELLEKEQLLGQVMDSVMKRIAFYLKHRGGESLRVEAIVFSNENGILGETSGAEELLEIIRAESVKEKRTGEKE